MAERAFYSPSLNRAWVTTGEPSEQIIAGWPSDWIEVELPVGEVVPRYAEGQFSWIDAPPQPIPLNPISKRQLRLTLVREGITLQSIEDLIASMPDGLQKEEAQIEWNDAPTFDRNHPTLLIIAQALNLAPTKVDEMWIKAMVA